MKNRGFSLLEVVVATGLLAVTVPLLFNLVPLALMNLQNSERLRVCSNLGQACLDEAYLVSLRPGLDVDRQEQIDGETYRVVREVYQVDPTRLDVVVQVIPPRGAAFRLATRVAVGEH